MNRVAKYLLAAAAILTTSVVAQPRPQGQGAYEGELVARRTCAFCHVVADDQTTPPLLKQATPSFREIANDPRTTAQSLRRFITTTHWDASRLPMTMPDPMLLDEEYNLVIAYVLSLRTVKTGAPEPSPPTVQGRRIEAGEELALRQCSYCHVVTSDPRYRPTLSQRIPSFEAIANDPGTTAQGLRRFITSTHWDEHSLPMAMPDQMLGPEEVRNVSSYILSLRK